MDNGCGGANAGEWSVDADGGAGLPLHPQPSGVLLAGNPSALPPAVPPRTNSGHFGLVSVSGSTRLSHDVSLMPGFPQISSSHSRAHSELPRLPDDVGSNVLVGVVESDEAEHDVVSMYMDMSKLNSLSETHGLFIADESSGTEVAPLAHTRAPPPPTQGGDNVGLSSGERPRIKHQQAQSMDGSMFTMPELPVVDNGGSSAPLADTKKGMSAAMLADLALVDPKRARRILTNRQSAAKSKERKMKYVADLEQKVQYLQYEISTLSTQLSLSQSETNALNGENNELKLRLQSMHQYKQLQDALNVALSNEIHRLKLVIGKMELNGASFMSFAQNPVGVNQQFYGHNQAMQPLLLASQQQNQIQPNHYQHQHQHQHQQQLNFHPPSQNLLHPQLLHPHPQQHLPSQNLLHPQLLHPHPQQPPQQQLEARRMNEVMASWKQQEVNARDNKSSHNDNISK